MRQVKAYAELQTYHEITGFAEAERVVSSFVATPTNIQLVNRIITDLVSARHVDENTQLPALQVLTGPRGVGKSHLLAFLRVIVGNKLLRHMIPDSNILRAIAAYNEKPVVALDLSFDGEENISFEAKLRQSLCDTLQYASYFDDEKWAAAVSGEQVFEQAFSALPLGTQMVVFIDNLPNRWNLLPETVEADLEWLALIERQASAFPLRVIVVRDDEPDYYNHNDPGIYYVPVRNVNEIISKRVVKKTGTQRTELEELYGDLLRQLPSFSWSKADFVDCYPVHPVVQELAPAFRSASQGFSLITFYAASMPRILSRPALSLIALDEVFDRYEYEFRKNSTLLPAFKLYDHVVSTTISKLPVSERLWAKLVLKALFAFSLAGQSVTAAQVANAQMLVIDDQPEEGYQRVAQILEHFQRSCPEAFITKGNDSQKSFVLSSVTQTMPSKLEAQVLRTSREIPGTDPALGDLLITTGMQMFTQLDGTSISAPGSVSMPPGLPLQFNWWGDVFTANLYCNDGAELDDGRKLRVRPFSPGAIDDCQARSESEVVWIPAAINGLAKLAPLRKLQALNNIAASRLDEGGEITDDMISLHERLTTEVRELFADVYLRQGKLVDSHSPEPVTPQWQSDGAVPASFSTFLATAFDRVLSNQYPSHPRFLETFSIAESQRIIREFFAGTEVTRHDREVCEMVRKFAVPLGLVSNSAEEGQEPRFELDIFSETAQRYPYIQTVLGCLDQMTDDTGLANVSLGFLEDHLFSPPFGLSIPAQQLVLGALLATNLIELYNDTAESLLTQKGLHEGFDTSEYSVVRRTSAVSYPVTVLADWARTLTGDPDLPIPQTMEAERKVREALNDWLTNWDELNLGDRFEQLPIDMLTVTSWRALDSNRRRFARVAAFAKAGAEGKMDVTSTLSRITDVFGFDRALLLRIQSEMQNLSGFLDWVPAFSELRNYLMAAEPTTREDIDELRTVLANESQDAFSLLAPGARERFEVGFKSFREAYIEHYAMLHEANVGPTANQELISNFCASEDWTRFRQLMELKIEGSAFDRDSQSLFKLAQETRCDLPVRELLQHQPHCCCSFKLHRRVHLDSLLDALKAIAGAAATFYSLAIWRHRVDLRNRAKEMDDPQFVEELETFLTSCGNGDLANLSSGMTRFINDALAVESMTSGAGQRS